MVKRTLKVVRRYSPLAAQTRLWPRLRCADPCQTSLPPPPSLCLCIISLTSYLACISILCLCTLYRNKTRFIEILPNKDYRIVPYCRVRGIGGNRFVTMAVIYLWQYWQEKYDNGGNCQEKYDSGGKRHMTIVARAIWQWWQHKYDNGGKRNMTMVAREIWQWWQEKYDNGGKRNVTMMAR